MEDYKLRLVDEYKQLKDRYEKLHWLIVKHDAHVLDFKLNCDIDLLKTQASIMGQYLNILEIRAVIEHIDLQKGVKT